LRVFLSYHSPDRAIALSLKRAIEDSLPGADVFVDPTHLRHGHLWQPRLFDVIGQAQAFLILVSHRAGDWQKFEYYEALDRKVKDDTFILLPIVVADRSKGPAANLPGLPQFHWIESTEPTAPDPLAKIVATLQGRDTATLPEPWRAINPYRGLVALEEQDADFFFGRESETCEIIDEIIAAPGRLIALVGNSGVGKSSLVQAGVIGSLKRQRWPGQQHAWSEVLKDSRAWAYLTMKPGENPIDELMSEFAALWFPDPTDPKRIDRRHEWAERLRGGKARLADVIKAGDDHLRNELSLTPPPRIFLYIDQGEELYVRSSPAERKRFSEIIADGVARNSERLTVMTSQRADYYGELQANAALFGLTNTIDVPPLDADKLTLVLREPARVLGVGFESDDFVSHIVKSAEDQPGALPLLADFFADLWERMRERGDGSLRVLDRREIIQVGAALSKRADQFLVKRSSEVDAVKRLFTLRLAHVPRQGEPVRARWERDAKRGTDPTIDAEWALVEQLAGPDWRLIVTGEKDGKATAELAHEVLFKTWATLKHWLEDEREFLAAKGQLEGDMADWRATPESQKSGALLSGNKLIRARDWLVKRPQDLSREGRQFIQTSVDKDVQQRRRNKLFSTLAFLTILGVAGYAIFEAHRAEHNAEVAQSENERADAELKKAQGALATAILADLDFQSVSFSARQRNVPSFSARQRNALWRLATADEGVRTSFISALTASPQDMARIAGGFSEVSRSLGLEWPSSADAERLLMTAAAAIAVNPEASQPLQVLAARLTHDQANRAFDLLLKQIGETTHHNALVALAEALKVLPAKLTDTQSQRALDHLLKQIGETTDHDAIWPLARAIKALMVNLTDAQAQRALDQLLQKVDKMAPYVLRLGPAQALETLAAELTGPQAQQTLEPLLQQISETTDPEKLLALARTLNTLQITLTDAQAQQTLDPLVKDVGNTASRYSPKLDALTALAAKLTDSQAQQARDRMLKQFDETTRPEASGR
jgi:hypothetical protein